MITDSAACFTAAQLCTLSSIIVVSYPWAMSSEQEGDLCYTLLYDTHTSKKKAYSFVYKRTWVKNMIKYILLYRIFRKDSAS